MSKNESPRPLSPIATRVQSRMIKLGLSQADLARRSGLTAVYLSELLRGAKQSVKPQKLMQLAVALETTVELLLGQVATERLSMAFPLRQPVRLPRSPQGERNPVVPRQMSSREEFQDTEEANRESAARSKAEFDALQRNIFDATQLKPFLSADPHSFTIPLYETSKNGSINIEGWLGSVIERPPILRNIEGAYAVRTDDRMSPRYMAGEVLYVAPSQTIRAGDFAVVVAQSRSDLPLTGYVHKVSLRFMSMVTLDSFNPQETTHMRRTDPIYAHKVVQSGLIGLD